MFAPSLIECAPLIANNISNEIRNYKIKIFSLNQTHQEQGLMRNITLLEHIQNPTSSPLLKIFLRTVIEALR